MGKLRDIIDLAEQLGISDDDIVDFRDSSEVDFTIDELKKVLEIGVKVKNTLGDNFDGCDLNDYYDHGYYGSSVADQVGLRIYPENNNGLSVHMLVEDGSIEVLEDDGDEDNFDTFSTRDEDIKKACDFAINMNSLYDEEEYDDEEYDDEEYDDYPDDEE